MKKKTITKLSRNGFILLMISALIGIIITTVLFINFEKLNKHIVNNKDIQKSFLDIKSYTHDLLTSSHLKESINNLNRFTSIYNKKTEQNHINSIVKNDWTVCLEEIENINQLINRKYFNDEHLKNRSLLKIEGELLHFSSATEFYSEITKLINSIKYLLQYETFILNEYEKHNIKNNSKQMQQIEQIKLYATFAAIIFFIFLFIITFYTLNYISKSETKLLSAQRFIHNIINNAPVRIFWKDKNSKFLGANKLFLEDNLLTDEKQLIGTSDYDYTSKELAQNHINDDKKIMTDKKTKIKYEEDVSLRNNEVRHIITSKIPLLDDSEKVVGILGIYDDMTQQKMLLDDVQKKEAMLIQQSRLAQMGEMISMIAHQWRQPLGAISAIAIDLNIKMQLELLDFESDKGLNETKKYLTNEFESIDSLVQNLTRTIDDFRNFYKLDKLLVNINVNEVILKALGIIKASIINNNIEIIEEYYSNNKTTLYDNELFQVILNILKNSQDNFIENKIKNPYIKITTDDNSISISDNGGGIQEDIIEKIFDPYFSTKNEKNGTGLGLYMSKIIIEEHHNGELNVKNIKDSDGSDGVCFNIKIGKITV